MKSLVNGALRELISLWHLPSFDWRLRSCSETSYDVDDPASFSVAPHLMTE